MSIKLMSLCWEKRFDTHAERDVMMALCDHANDEGICWPSRGLIAWKIDRHPDTVKAAMRDFRDRGIIETRRGANNDLSKSPVIRVLPHKLPDKAPYGDRGVSDPPGGGASDPPDPGVPHPPKPSGEPPGEPSVPTGGGNGGAAPTAVSLCQHTMKAIYQAMKDARFAITRKDYGQQVGRVQWMLDNMEPTDAELEGLPAAYVRAFKIRGPATDAVYALNELRRQEARAEVLAESDGPAPWERLNPASEEGLAARGKPRRAEWYMAAFPYAHPATIETLLATPDVTHDGIMAVLEDTAKGA